MFESLSKNKTHETKVPRPATKEDKYCFFMIAVTRRWITAACSPDIKNISHKQLATNTGYAAIHYCNPGVSIASSLVQQNQLAASNNFAFHEFLNDDRRNSFPPVVLTFVIIYTKKLLNSDWPRKECSSSVTRVQITNGI